MAITYGGGKAGQFAKSKAFQYQHQNILLIMTAVLIGGVLCGFLLTVGVVQRFGWFRWIETHNWPLIVVEVGILVTVIAGLRRVDKYSDILARERIGWLRGGQGEALVAWYLNRLPNTWHVFHNVKLWDHGDLDHVLIGPGGLFCISTKAYRGQFTTGPDGTYFLNGKPNDDIQEAKRLAMQLKDRLAESLDTVPWVQAVLIAPLAHIDFPTYQERVWVLHEENLPDVFENEKTELNAAEIERCAKAVKMIVENARGL
ncbi:MAG: nuclease-related domain-containing protein [Tepidisphaeraceae bacterium]|jgi:hypothetical protein